MSKLIQRIEQVGKSTPAPLGFGVSARQQPSPAFAVIASTAVESKASTIGEGQADGVLFTPDTVDIEALAAAASCLGDIPWGVRLQSADRTSVESLRGKGCDFIAFLPSGVALDGAGNLYIAEFGNSRIRKVDTSGTITTVAGTGSTN